MFFFSLVWHVATQAVSKRKESSDDQLGTFPFSSTNCLFDTDRGFFDHHLETLIIILQNLVQLEYSDFNYVHV